MDNKKYIGMDVNTSFTVAGILRPFVRPLLLPI
jgi:hypothetical protein